MRRLAFLVALLLVLGATSAFAGAHLWNLGAGACTGMTTDGAVVAYNSGSNAGIWSSQYGAKNLGAGTTAGCTWKGSTLIVAGKSSGMGKRWDGNAAGTGSWSTLAMPATDETFIPISPTGIASDGTNVMISCVSNYTGGGGTAHACRYKDDGTTQWATDFDLPKGADGQKAHDNSYFFGVSQNDIPVGQAQYTGSGGGGARQAICASTAVMKNLWGNPDSAHEACAKGISADGSRMFGWSPKSTGSDCQALYWNAPYTTSTTPVAIPLPTGTYWSAAMCSNSTGTIIGGTIWGTGDAWQDSFIWDATNGTRRVSTVLAAAGISTTGWVFSNDATGHADFGITGISTDGKWLSGTGTYNRTQSTWVAFIPEPSSFSVLAIGLLGLLKLRRRS